MLINLSKAKLIERLEQSGRLNLADDAIGWWTNQGAVKDKATTIINERLLDAGVLFETRSLNLLPLPFVFSQHLKDSIESKFSSLHRIIERIPDFYRQSAEVQKFFRLPPMIDEFVRIECNVLPNVFLCRFDFSLSDAGTPRIYELNAAAPAALSFSPYFYEAVASTDLFAQIKSLVPFSLKPFEGQRRKLFLRAIRDFVSTKNDSKELTIGIVNSKINTMVNELTAIEKEAQELGIKAVRCFVEDLEFREGKLFAHGNCLDAIFALHPARILSVPSRE
jgi:glutathionylspermidine synthase